VKQRVNQLSTFRFFAILIGVAFGIIFISLSVFHHTIKFPKRIEIFESPQQKPIRKKILVYNVNTLPKWNNSHHLQTIVDDVVALIARKSLPTESLSISLINLKNPKSLTFAGYREQELRFPASVSKLFWMVDLYAQIQAGELPDKTYYYSDLYRMIQKSDNNSASRILDLLTQTTSGEVLDGEAYGIWVAKRKSINQFFQNAGYTNININQKNFPIPDLKLELPEGRDLQIRGKNLVPIRNRMTSSHAARLMYEIFTDQAVSPESCQEMKKLLTRDLRPEVWKKEQYNSIEGFLGESLLIYDVYFASKVGWTSSSRQEVAFIESRDGRVRYILSVFADDPAYAEDWKIFPEISQFVFNRLAESRLE
jgi:hypothetical protein